MCSASRCRSLRIVELVKVNNRHAAACTDSFLFPVKALIFGLEFTVGNCELSCTFRIKGKQVNDAVVEVDEDLTFGARLLCQLAHECCARDQLGRGVCLAEIMLHGLEVTGQLGYERDTIAVDCHKNSSDCRFLKTEELMKAAKWV